MTRLATLATTIALSLIAVGSAAAQQNVGETRRVGRWDVEAVDADGKFVACRAMVTTPEGRVGILQYPSGRWMLSIPDLPHPDGHRLNGGITLAGRSWTFTLAVSRRGSSEVIPIDPTLLEALRGGGDLGVAVGGRTFGFRLSDAATAIGAVQDCRAERARATPTTATRPVGGAPAARAPDVLRPTRRIGDWTVSAAFAGPTLQLCRASLHGRDGEVSIVHWSNGAWGIGLPDLGRRPGSGEEGTIGMGRASVPFRLGGGAHPRPIVPIDAAMRSALVESGFLSLRVGHDSRSWYVRDGATVLEALQTCRKDAGAP